MPCDDGDAPGLTRPLPRARPSDTIGGMSELSGNRADDIFPAVYAELRALAAARLAAEPAGHTLQPTALVHEVYLRLAGRDGGWADRSHFLAAASRAMRHVLVDHARRRRRVKRGG